MEQNYLKPLLVEKENIGALRFPSCEVLNSLDAISQRKLEIERAMLLGNRHKGKSKIVFEDDEGVKQVETTIWGFTDKRIILKQEFVIPIHRIYQVII
ncbi:MAG: hypothetical protein H0X46_09755 [Bacteroidetes bacterium]|nr:hypothetical protein [Bacteroidota bacterium]